MLEQWIQGVQMHLSPCIYKILVALKEQAKGGTSARKNLRQ